MINLLPQNYVNFQGGLKKNIKKGEKALHEYKEEFPSVYSSTFWHEKIVDGKKRGGKQYYGAESYNIRKAVEIDRCRARANDFFESDYDNFLKITKNYMKNEHVGNCGECADVMREYLKKDFPDVKVVHMSMPDIKRDHVFCVVGIKPDAKISKPSTWGNKAVVVDPWRNIISSVPDAMREYEQFYGFKYDKDGTDCIITEKLYPDNEECNKPLFIGGLSL